MSTIGEQKRKAKRIGTFMPVDFVIDYDALFHHGRAINVSRTGLFLRAPELLDPGTSFSIAVPVVSPESPFGEKRIANLDSVERSQVAHHAVCLQSRPCVVIPEAARGDVFCLVHHHFITPSGGQHVILVAEYLPQIIDRAETLHLVDQSDEYGLCPVVEALPALSRRRMLGGGKITSSLNIQPFGAVFASRLIQHVCGCHIECPFILSSFLNFSSQKLGQSSIKTGGFAPSIFSDLKQAIQII